MPVRRLSHIAFAPLILLIAGLARGTDAKAEAKQINLDDLLRPLKLAANTEAIATRQGYVLHEINTGAVDAKAQAGDTVTALVQLHTFRGKRPPSQWIIRLTLADRSTADSPQGPARDFTQYTNTGEKFTFHSEQTRMQLETLGPIKADTKPDQSLPVKRQEISVAADFLSLDLNRAAQVIGRISASHDPHGLSLNTGPNPFPDNEVNAQKPRAAALNLTSDNLRSFSGGTIALEQFLHIVQSTPDLQVILFQVLDKPSLIDVFRSGANSSIGLEFLFGFEHANGVEIFWPETKPEDFGLLVFNLVLYKKPILSVGLFVTTPRPPLLLTAGIVGIVAMKPKPGMADKFVVVRVLSATAGSSPGPATEIKR